MIIRHIYRLMATNYRLLSTTFASQKWWSVPQLGAWCLCVCVCVSGTSTIQPQPISFKLYHILLPRVPLCMQTFGLNRWAGGGVGLKGVSANRQKRNPKIPVFCPYDPVMPNRKDRHITCICPPRGPTHMVCIRLPSPMQARERGQKHAEKFHQNFVN